MNKKILALVLAGVCALGGVLAVVGYARGADARAYEGAVLTPVLVVTEPVPAGSPASRMNGSVKTVEVPQSVVADGAVSDLTSLGGEVTTAALVPGEQVVSARFGDQVAKAKKSALEPGMQKMDVVLTSPRVPAGISDGDIVGVVASYGRPDGNGGTTRLTLNRVKVLAVKNSMAAVEDPAAGAGAAAKRLTLVVSTHQAEKIANAAEFGKVWLTLQNDKTDVRGSQRTETKDVVG